jgi:hypothetical protein
MRSISTALLGGVSSQAFAHAGHGLVLPHFHSADTWLLLGIAVAIAGAFAAWKIK